MGLSRRLALARISMRHMEMRTFTETCLGLMTMPFTHRREAFGSPLR